MIKINLLGEEVVESSGGKLIIAAYVGSLVLLVGVFYFMQASISRSIDDLSMEKQALESQLAKLKEVTKEVRLLEKNREELKNKLTVIATLKRNKSGPVRVMNDLNAFIPDRAWVKEVREKDNQMRIQGVALDNQTVSTFAKGLSSSDYFPNVELVESRNLNYKGVTVKEFILQAKVRYVGKIATEAPPPGEPPSGEKKAS